MLNNVFDYISGKFYLPLRNYKNDRKMNKWVRFVKKIEKLSLEELETFQSKQILNILKYVKANVPYYSKIMMDIKMDLSEKTALEYLKQFPILTKSNIKENQNLLISNLYSNDQLIKNTTGGSTGTPLEFYQDKNYINAGMANDICYKNWFNIKIGDRTTSFWGSDIELKDWTTKEKLLMWFERENMFDSFAMTEEKMHKFAKKLMKWQPKYMKGYASSLHLFSKFLLKNPEYIIRPYVIRSTAESLFDHQRFDIEKAFNCKVINFYGSREVNNIASECQYQKGLHIFSGTRVVEIVDKNDNVLPHGELGRIVVTDLINEAMPFIRYENGDLGIMSSELCECGLSYPVLEKVSGRVSDILVGRDGQLIHGEFVTHLFYDQKGVKSFQLIQDDIDNYRLSIQKDSTNNSPDFQRIVSKLKDRLGNNIFVDITVIDNFIRNNSGKHRFVISKISPFDQK